MSLSPEEQENVRVTVTTYLPDAADVFVQALDDMLTCTQEQFGPRDPSFMVSRLVFGSDHPKVSHPWRPARGMSIRLSDGALRWAKAGYHDYAFWQLAHETIHLLSPAPGSWVGVLEEGLACCFQHDYMRERSPEYEVPSQYYASYQQAERLTRQLLSLNAEAVREMRRVERTIGRITAGLIRRHCPALPMEAAEALAGRFVRGYAPLADGTQWPFSDPPSTVVETTAEVADGEQSIHFAHHDEGGGWLFLGANEPATEAELVVSLHEIVSRDSSVCALADLPRGGTAWRDRPDADWQYGGTK